MGNESSRQVTLLSGDPCLVEDIVLAVKRKFFPKGPPPSRWIVFDPPVGRSEEKKFMLETMNAIGSEASSPPFDGIKFVVIKHMPAVKSFIAFCQRILSQIPEENRVIFWDYEGDVYKNLPKWEGFVSAVSKLGTIVRKDPPISQLPRSDQEKWVCGRLAAFHKKISQEDAGYLLDMAGNDRRMLNNEMGKLAVFCQGEEVSKADIDVCVFPVSTDYPVYHFYNAINRGRFYEVMESAELLVSDVGFSYDAVLGLTLKQLRWHIIASHALLHGHNGREALKALGAPKDTGDLIDKWNGARKTNPRMWKNLDDVDKKKKPESLTSTYMISDILGFVDDFLLKTVPLGSAISAREWAAKRSMERYVEAYNGMVDCRTSSKDAAAIFTNVMQRICYK